MRVTFVFLFAFVLTACSNNPCDAWRADVQDAYDACGVSTDECPVDLMNDLSSEDADQVDCVTACDLAASCEALDGTDADAATALDECRAACGAGA